MNILTIILAVCCAALTLACFKLRAKLNQANSRAEQDCKRSLEFRQRMDDFTDIINYGEWAIEENRGAYLVGKIGGKSLNHLLVLKEYRFNMDDPDDKHYARNCAEELLDKLNEKI